MGVWQNRTSLPMMPFKIKHTTINFSYAVVLFLKDTAKYILGTIPECFFRPFLVYESDY